MLNRGCRRRPLSCHGSCFACRKIPPQALNLCPRSMDISTRIPSPHFIITHFFNFFFFLLSVSV
ncbi:hypothetical protein BT93_G0443 [Corymbia citriodora subsp. variegata]|nr:hypothetical protein BT93_G0443 [Corymbia citriodora subsp. variegata]